MKDYSAPRPKISLIPASLTILLIFFFQFVLVSCVGKAAAQGISTGQVRQTVTPLNLSYSPSMQELMAAGQLGGQLYPTQETNPVQQQQINLSFGEAIQAWNQHNYKAAVEMFRQHVALYPQSPWAAESVLHCGCDALYNGRYNEADRDFQSIIVTFQGSSHPGAQMMVHKARLRLANLRTAQGNYSEAINQLAILKQSSPDWRHRTYAAHWIQRLSRDSHSQSAVLNCGFQALAYLLEKRGKKNEAEKILALKASSDRGQNMKELKSLAAGYGYRLTGLRLTTSQLKKIPLPAIVQLNGLKQGDLGHFWVLEARTRDTLTFYDPQSRRRFTQTKEEFSKEWAGNTLAFTQKQKLPGIVLAAEEMVGLYGGCCGVPRPASDLGTPENPPYDPDCPDRGDSCNNPKPGCGSPTWSVNKVNMNFVARDIPLWYQSPIGPPVEIALTYNSQSAIANYEPFGNKWQFNYASYPIEDSGGNVTIFMPDGRRDVYTPNSSGGYTAPPGVYNTLVKTAPTHYELWFPGDTVYIYDIPTGTNSLQPFLVQIRDPHSLTLSFGYDANVHLTTITDAMGQVTNLSYNANGQITSVTDPFGRQATFTYDANSNLITITDMGGYSSSLTYDQNCFITSIGNARGTWNFYTEPADGINNGSDPYPAPGGTMWEDYRITVTNPLGNKEEYHYCAINSYSWHVNPMNYVTYIDQNHSNYTTPKTKYSFTQIAGKGKISRIDRPVGDELSYTLFGYDSVGNLTRAVRQLLGGWDYTYNSLGKLSSFVNGYGKPTTLTYAPNNVDLVSVSDYLGADSRTYNSTHDVTSITDRMGNITTFTHNSYGQVTSITDALGIVNNYVYDSSNRLVAITRAGQTIHQYTYDTLGRISSHTDASGLTLGYTYNNLDQVTAISYPDGKSKIYQYSTCCPFRLDSITERSGQTTFFSYDQNNHLLSITDPANGVTSFTYDLNGNRASLTDRKDITTSFQYDFNNRLIQKNYADGKSVTYSYLYGTDLVNGITNARGTTTNFWYDKNYQLTSFRDYLGNNYWGPQNNFNRDADNYGRITSVQSSNWDSFYTRNCFYDANFRLIKTQGPWLGLWGHCADTVTYQYDALGRRTGLTRQNGQPITYTYDNLNRLTTVTVGAATYTYGYSGASPLVQSLTRSDGSVTSYQYDLLNRLTLMTTTVSGVTVSQYAYTYNQQDQRDSETSTDPTPAYSDALMNYTYNNVNQLTQLGAQNLTYDADGNLTGGYTPQGYPFTATYDSINRLSTLSYTDGAGAVNLTKFSYLAGPQLGRKTNYKNGSIIQDSYYVPDGFSFQMLQDASANNGGSSLTLRNEYTYGVGLPGGIGGLLSVQQSGVAGPQYSYLYDGKGNVTALLNGSSGQVAQGYQYDPFGVPMGSSGSVTQPVRFSTKLYDDQTGLSYYGNRFYIPALGRWMTRDPLGEKGGTNLYAFTDNNPVNRIDPDGLVTIYYGVGATVYYGNKGMVTASEGALLYSDDTPLFGGNYYSSGKQKSPCGEGNYPVKGAGAGIGPLFGFFTGNLDTFRGISDNITIDFGAVGVTYSSNASGWGLSFAWGGAGYGLGYNKYQTTTVAWGYR